MESGPVETESRDAATLRSRGAALPLSAVVLVAGNLLPLVGVFYWGWQVYPLLLLFWLENIVVGIFNLLRMAVAAGGDLGAQLSKIFLVPFFSIHYGGFTLVHGVLVIALFGGAATGGGAAQAGPGFDPADLGLRVWLDVEAFQLAWPLLALVLSHGFSFVTNYLGRGEYLRITPHALMGRPYGRIVALHVTILLGGFLVLAAGSHWAALLLLIVIKIGMDLRAHLGERRKLSSASRASQPTVGASQPVTTLSRG